MYKLPGVTSSTILKCEKEKREPSSQEIIAIAAQMQSQWINPSFVEAVTAPLHTYDPHYKDIPTLPSDDDACIDDDDSYFVDLEKGEDVSVHYRILPVTPVQPKRIRKFNSRAWNDIEKQKCISEDQPTFFKTFFSYIDEYSKNFKSQVSSGYHHPPKEDEESTSSAPFGEDWSRQERVMQKKFETVAEMV